MKTKTYQYDDVIVTIIDHCTDEKERKQRIEEALKKFTLSVEGKKKNYGTN